VLDNPIFEFRQMQEIFIFFFLKSEPLLGPNQPPILLVRGFWGEGMGGLGGVKRLVLQSDYSPV
jgi:hypothetical protein